MNYICKDMYETGFISENTSNTLRKKQNLHSQIISNLCESNKSLYPIQSNVMCYGDEGNIKDDCECTKWVTLKKRTKYNCNCE